MSRRRNILPVFYFQRRICARKQKRNEIVQVPQQHVIRTAQPNVQENYDMQMNEVDQVQQEARQNEIQNELNDAKRIIAKREKQVEAYERTIQNLQSLLGIVDLTEDIIKEYDEVLLSSDESENEEDHIGSGDKADDDDPDKENQEPNTGNQLPNAENRKQVEMMFSFSREFIVDVSIMTLRFFFTFSFNPHFSHCF